MQVSSRSQGSLSLGASVGVISVLALALLATLAPAAMASPATASYVVVLKDDVAHPAYLAHRHEENRGAEVGHIYGVALKGYSADLTSGQLKAIKKDPNVDYVESDGVIRPKGQAVGNQLKRVYANLSRLHIDENDVPADRVNADIAILDTGVYQHPDLNVVSRVDCEGGGGGCKPGQPDDDKSGHGTHVAGDAAAIDNGIGMVGTAPGARIWSVKVVTRMSYAGADQVGTKLSEPYDPAVDLQLSNAQMSDAIAGINYVTAHSSEIEVANMSFACSTSQWGCAHTALKEAIATSVNNGVVWVAAAGHDGDAVTGIEQVGVKNRHYPALLSDVITVSAMADYDGLPGSLSNSNGCPLEKGTQHDDRLMGEGKPSANTDFLPAGSNFGPEVDITAPGSCVFSTWSPYPLNNRYDIPYGAEYGFMYGSSVASALVAGAAADLAAEFNPNSRADVEKIKNTLISAGNYNWEDLVTDGIGGPYVSPDGVKEPLLDMGNLVIPKSPSTTTGGVENITTSTAKLVGWLNPNGATTSFYFQYGPTTAYGNTVPAPAATMSGTSPQIVAFNVGNLEPETTYHFRLVATNSLGTSTGADMTFRTQAVILGSPSVLLDQADDQTWVHSRNTSTAELQYANWKPSKSWTTTNLGTQIRAGSKPAPLLDNLTKQQWIYFVDADGILRYWNWKAEDNTWKPYVLGSTVRQGTSPVAVLDQQTKQQWVYFVTPGGQLRYWNWKMGEGWKEYSLGSTMAVALNSSPTVVFDEATKETNLYFVRTEMALGQWRWSGPGWQEGILTSSVRANTSPTAVLHPGSKQQWVYYIGSDNQIHYYNYDPAKATPWGQYAMPVASSLAPNTGLAAIIDPATYQQWLYYTEPSGNIGLWNWKMENAWKPYSLTASVAPGTTVAPALDLTSKQQWVYYRNPGGTISYLKWDPATGVWKAFP